jgi:hypothetical protein
MGLAGAVEVPWVKCFSGHLPKRIVSVDRLTNRGHLSSWEQKIDKDAKASSE